ncbi:MAG: tripartite tricarboxylate transporter substrate binding protein, partial [Proteobacteria bacterium]|nr:tripartite tricarboxylate transporter substrate binding protein [Pseudomonadota bacterium]
MKLLTRSLLLTLTLFICTSALAQYPNRPIRLIVPATAGDGSDVLARLVGRHLADALGQPIVIENRPGAGGSIAGAAVATASPDGYTLMLANGSSHGVTPGLYPKLPYDTLKDFAAVTMIASSPNLLVVNPSLPASTIAEFLAYARANPGKVNVASAGNGSLSHLSVEMLKSLGRIDIVNVGYKGAAPALNDLVAGQVAAMIINIPSTLPLVKAGKLRALAATSAGRTQLMPELPTLAEAGLTGYETLAWFGLVAPAKTPPEVIARLQSETAKVLVRPDVRAQLTNLGAEPSGNSS